MEFMDRECRGKRERGPTGIVWEATIPVVGGAREGRTEDLGCAAGGSAAGVD
jgi:hypothetical protein